jgi:DivIVA domain-containing protein
VKWFILFVGIVTICFVAALLLGMVGGGMGGPGSSLSHERLPEGELHDEDLDELVFDVSFRGYRMSQVDGVVDRLRRELREKDEHIAYLQGSAAGGEPAVAGPDDAIEAEPVRAEDASDLEPDPAGPEDASEVEPERAHETPKA